MNLKTVKQTNTILQTVEPMMVVIIQQVIKRRSRMCLLLVSIISYIWQLPLKYRHVIKRIEHIRHIYLSFHVKLHGSQLIKCPQNGKITLLDSLAHPHKWHIHASWKQHLIVPQARFNDTNYVNHFLGWNLQNPWNSSSFGGSFVQS